MEEYQGTNLSKLVKKNKNNKLTSRQTDLEESCKRLKIAKFFIFKEFYERYEKR